MKTIPKLYRLLAEARAEYDREYDNLLLYNLKRADRFRAEIEKGFAAISSRPKHFGFISGYSFRSYGPTKSDSYRIAYVESATEIVIVAIYYTGAADPNYWVERVF